jgi:hypothetical protein
MALSDTALKALKPRETPYTVTDDQGLYVEVLTTGSIIWRYRYRLNGKREKLTLGKYPDLTLKNARMKRDEAAQPGRRSGSRLMGTFFLFRVGPLPLTCPFPCRFEHFSNHC